MITLGGESGYQWPADPEIDYDGSSVVGLTQFDPYGLCTWESSGGVIIASTSNPLYHQTTLYFPTPSVGNAKVFAFDFYIPSASPFCSFRVGFLGLEAYGLANQNLYALTTGYSVQPVVGSITLDAWHAAKFVLFGGCFGSLFIDDVHQISANVWSNSIAAEPWQISQIRVPVTADKNTKAVRFRNLRGFVAQTGLPNIE